MWLVISLFYDLEGELAGMNGNWEVVSKLQKKDKSEADRDDLIEFAVLLV